MDKELLDTSKEKQLSEPLTANEVIFADYVARGFSYTQSYRMAYKAWISKRNIERRSNNKPELTEQYIRRLAYTKATKVNVSTEVATAQARLTASAHKAVNRLTEVIETGKEHNAVNASIFIYEQTFGKARQTTEVIGKHVVVSYDLSGGTAGPVPQEILDQLKDDV